MEEFFAEHPELYEKFKEWQERQQRDNPEWYASITKPKTLKAHDIHGRYFTMNPEEGLIHIKTPLPATSINLHNESLGEVIRRILRRSSKIENKIEYSTLESEKKTDKE